MRLRTGHGANDWTENDPGAFARLSEHSGGSIHGELVRGGPGDAERQRQQQRDHMRRYRAKPVDMNDYQKEHRWEGTPRCGAMMKQARQPCARALGHRREHKSAEAMEYQRQSRRVVRGVA